MLKLEINIVQNGHNYNEYNLLTLSFLLAGGNLVTFLLKKGGFDDVAICHSKNFWVGFVSNILLYFLAGLRITLLVGGENDVSDEKLLHVVLDLRLYVCFCLHFEHVLDLLLLLQGKLRIGHEIIDNLLLCSAILSDLGKCSDQYFLFLFNLVEFRLQPIVVAG